MLNATKKELVGVVMAYLVGQGVADNGKSAALINAAAPAAPANPGE